ncbi:PTS system mannose/fructose/N-acetylgalactosamine-transporter subunit IIB [Anaerosinus massiliensis]|uniref:PTS system mannose/fructose/N-acetylgalactosamine-transporter subunit IIB n=1 Tax=Massilibacillus massiliensis TaxID=1806837 RepID=UPI000DA61E8A|nr:PTS sugar transporter subunit IIB [Massilibacillus massiliensis]
MKNIVFTRVDDRLIHGQVMTGWIQYTGASKVVVIDDKVAKDMFMASIMQASMPAKIKLKILGIDDAASYLQKDADDEKLFLLVKTPIVLAELIKKGVDIKQIGVGGMGAKADRTKLYRNIAASEEERAVLKELLQQGIDAFIQVIPDSDRVDLKSVL